MPDARGSTGGNDERFSSGPLFQIPPSQDVLAQTSTQDISTGFSQSGECMYKLLVQCIGLHCREGETNLRDYFGIILILYRVCFEILILSAPSKSWFMCTCLFVCSAE